MPGTVSRAALQGVNATTNISITALSGNVVNDLTSTLALQTGAANSAVFDAGTGAFTFTDTSDSFSTAGGELEINAGTTATLGGLSTSGTGDVIIVADNMSLNQAISSGAGTVRLEAVSTAQVIDLGGADAAGRLGLDAAELLLISSTTTIVGDATNTGGVQITTNVNVSNSNSFELVTAGAITDAGGFVLTGFSLGMTAGTGIGTFAAPIKTNITNIEAITNTGGIFVSEFNGLNIGGVNATLTGVTVVTAGNIVVSLDNGDLEVNAAVANQAAGNVTLEAEANVEVNAPVSTSGLGQIRINADTNKGGIGSFINSAGGTLTGDGNPIIITAEDVFVAGTLTSKVSVIFQPQDASQLIDVGGASGGAAFGIDDTELGFVNAPVAHIGTLVNTGGIEITAPITRHAGFDTIFLIDNGPISQTAPISVAKLAVQASTGDAILTDASNDVDFIAGSADDDFLFTDVDDFVITAVDARISISAGLTNKIVLNAGGAVTQTGGAIVRSGDLLLTGFGSFVLNDPDNEADTLASNALSGVTYVDIDDLTIGSVDGINGISSFGPIDIGTANGDLIVTDTIGGNDVISAFPRGQTNRRGQRHRQPARHPSRRWRLRDV